MELIWKIVTWACLVWYSTITVYVGYKGIFDIKQMLRDLSADHDKKQVHE